jgi:hypothetical protein
MLKEDAKPEEINEEFIAHFIDGNRLVADEDMRTLWAKLLAGEANKPGSYSVRTLRFLSTLRKTEAESFTRFCRFVVNFGDADLYIPPATVRRVPLVLDFTDPIYVENGVTFETLMDLAAIGLIVFNPATVIKGTLSTHAIGIRYLDDFAFAKCLTADQNQQYKIPFGFAGFSPIGHELSYIAGAEKVPALFFYLAEKWRISNVAICSVYPRVTVGKNRSPTVKQKTESIIWT